MMMNPLMISSQDEYPHAPFENPQWREGYHFNAYDEDCRKALSISIGIRPALGIREEVISLHGDLRLVYVGASTLKENPLASGTFNMEPVDPLRSWNIHINDSFHDVGGGSADSLQQMKVEVAFESGEPVLGYSTDRGDRYEQPGSLSGDIHLGHEDIPFRGRGMRDHSWEVRDMSVWKEWYSLMSCAPGITMFLSLFKSDSTTTWEGWLKEKDYSYVKTLDMVPTFSSGQLTQCQVQAGTSETQVDVLSTVLSHIFLSTGKPESTLEETLVQVDGGYGVLWHGRTHLVD